MKVLIFLFMFFVIGGLFIIGNNKLFLNNVENRNAFSDYYFIWLGDIFENTKTITGQVFHLDWLPSERGR